MTRSPRLCTAVLLVLLAASTSCRWFRQPKPPPQPARLPVQAAPAKPEPPPPLEAPPNIPTSAPRAGDVPGAEPQPLPPPPEEQKRPSPAGPRVSQPPPTEPAATTPAAPPPQLRPTLSPAERQKYERSIYEMTNRAKGILASVGSRSLSREQAALEAQVRTFLQQAEEARTSDPLRAYNLAERAEVLALDLAKRLR